MVVQNTSVTTEPVPQRSTEVWKSITVLGELLPGHILHPGTKEILGKARELADQANAKVSLVLIGTGLIENARSFFPYGPDRIFIYDDPVLEHISQPSAALILADYIRNYPSRVLFFADTQSERAIISELTTQISEKTTDVQPLINIQKESDLDLISNRFDRAPILQKKFPYDCPILASVSSGVFPPIIPSEKHSGEIIICEVRKDLPQGN